MTDKIKIELSKDEALVLFELLSRFNENHHDETFKDQAEQRVLWDTRSIGVVKLIEHDTLVGTKTWQLKSYHIE